MKIERWIGLLLLFGSSLFAGDTLSWETNYASALEKSRQEGKPLLLFFNGSDWSGWGMKMKKEVLDQESFAEKIAARFICVEIDFPIHKRLSSEQIKQNQQLKEQLAIDDYPRLVLLDAKERQIARFGYTQEKAAEFAGDLLRTLEQDSKLGALLATLDKKEYASSELEEYYHLAQELQRMEEAQRILDVGLTSAAPLFFLLEKYRLLVEGGRRLEVAALGIREQLLRSDPENEEGVHFSVALIDFQDLASHNAPAKEIVKPLENYLALFGKRDVENVWRVEMMLAQFYLDYDECQIALRHAETAFKTAPTEMQEEIGHSVAYIRKQLDQSVDSIR